jgi:hypothetical protein
MTTFDRPIALPPEWAEALLRVFLSEHDRESVTGDLLEEYRETIVPSLGARANRWYVRQVAGFVWRANATWALLFAGAFLARTAYDWRVPTTDFAWRSTVSTWTGMATLFAAAASAAWRSRSVSSGVVTAMVSSQIAAVMSVAGAALLLAIWHDPQTQAAIAGSGGLAEVFVLPFVMIIPAVIVGTAGALLGRAVSTTYSPRPKTNNA